MIGAARSIGRAPNLPRPVGQILRPRPNVTRLKSRRGQAKVVVQRPRMSSIGIDLATTAALIGDVARANMLDALMGGRALTAGELAWHARVSAQTASGHLAKLAEARLVAREKQGRHRYYRLASQEAAEAV
jgi:DNA-binding transcriptional ArsR family regulator